LTARTSKEEATARDVIGKLLELVPTLGVERQNLGILSQMGPFSKIHETTYTFGLATEPEIFQGFKVLFSLRNVCRYPDGPSRLPWAVNHIAIFHQLGKGGPCWLVMEDYDSVFPAQPAIELDKSPLAGMLDLCNIGWTTALRDMERLIYELVPPVPNPTRLEGS
jgi:hypothetical protein